MGEDRKAIIKRSQAKRRAKFKEMGLCVQCGKQPSITGQTLCEDCKRKTSVMQKRYYARKKEPGRISNKTKAVTLCASCKNGDYSPKDAGYICCSPCIIKEPSKTVATCIGYIEK